MTGKSLVETALFTFRASQCDFVQPDNGSRYTEFCTSRAADWEMFSQGCRQMHQEKRSVKSSESPVCSAFLCKSAALGLEENDDKANEG